ncbi:MAG: hypothetical protein OXD42_05445 [Rhodospirillaceae bacterium]|nr:hypothetical protein [Rhodospirillaceae bacterium]
MRQVNYDFRLFRPVQTAENGEVNAGPLLRYRQDGPVFRATCEGGVVIHGHMVGNVKDDGGLYFRYHHLSMAQEGPSAPVSGLCHSRLEVLRDGRYRLFEEWRWTISDGSFGTSVAEQVAA